MRAYRSVWRSVVLLVAVAAGIIGIAGVGWLATLGTSAAFACLGALFGFSWVEEPRLRPRAMVECTLWFGVAGLLIIGLPPVVGAWTLPLLILVGVSCPPLLDLALASYRKAHPVAEADVPGMLSDRDLARRWRWTTDALQDRSTPVASALLLVQERSALLDELERRDPDRFAEWLVRSGWREPQDR
ncbi:MAG: hypothetical protein H6529_15870 [Nocardioides sp.]|nr:hypothetical protein [Nocardioidaceae bacterium]MCB8957944.1 hypothetical protein [Nocardioides sp.]